MFYCRSIKGLLIQSLSTLFMSLMNILSKHLFITTRIQPMELTYYRSVLLCITGLCITFSPTILTQYDSTIKPLLHLLLEVSPDLVASYLLFMETNSCLSHYPTHYFTLSLYLHKYWAIIGIMKN